jgi:putative flippase GtrA
LAAQTLPHTYALGDARQFVKFGLVGVSNNVVDYLTWRVMMGQFHWGWLPAQLVAFVVNVISLGFGLLLMKTMLVVLTGQISHAGPEKLIHLNIAKAVAIVCCVVWNYSLNKKWTFK